MSTQKTIFTKTQRKIKRNKKRYARKYPRKSEIPPPPNIQNETKSLQNKYPDKRFFLRLRLETF